MLHFKTPESTVFSKTLAPALVIISQCNFLYKELAEYITNLLSNIFIPGKKIQQKRSLTSQINRNLLFNVPIPSSFLSQFLSVFAVSINN